MTVYNNIIIKRAHTYSTFTTQDLQSQEKTKKHEKIQYSVPILNLTYSEFKCSNVQKDAVGSIFFLLLLKV